MDAARVDGRGGWMLFSLDRRMRGNENHAAASEPRTGRQYAKMSSERCSTARVAKQERTNE